jgi:hypothetical protein
MFEIGKVNTLIVSRETSSGFYLKDGEEYGEVFLPPSMSKKVLSIGDSVDVFLYIDTKDQVVATCATPIAQVGEYAVLDCIDVQDFGAFFDLGIEKHLLVPGNEQKEKVSQNNEYLLRVCIEEGTDRIFGTTKLGKYIESSEFDIEVNQKVDLFLATETDLGIRVIINKKFIGIIYQSEIFTNVKLGTTVTGYVKKIRDDGFVDCALQIQGIKNLDKSKIKIMEFLHRHNGRSHLNDKSSPEEIMDLLGMSKKTFKSSLGMLYKHKKVIISKDGIEIVKNDPNL